MPHRTGNAEAGAIDRYSLPHYELPQRLAKSFVICGLVNLLHRALQAVAFELECCQADVRSTNIAGENHGTIFLHWRPSRAISSSESFGPQLPAT